MMKRLVRDAREQLGWQGIAGLVLLLVAGSFFQLALNPLEKETSLMHSRLEAARSAAGSAATAFTAAGGQAEVVELFASLPREKDVTDTLAALYNVAEAAGVEFQEAEYHVDNANPPAFAYEISFPMRGEYPKIRVFLSRALADNPALALDHISLQRDHIGDAILKADVRFTLFLRPSP